jgi:hypothetical protein
MKTIASTGDTNYGDGRQLCLADRNRTWRAGHS